MLLDFHLLNMDRILMLCLKQKKDLVKLISLKLNTILYLAIKKKSSVSIYTLKDFIVASQIEFQRSFTVAVRMLI